jgi:hypothetical protein
MTTINVAFEGEDLSDDTKFRIQETFNTVVAARVEAISKILEDACVEAAMEELSEQHQQAYRDWLNENREIILNKLQIEKVSGLSDFLLSEFLENFCVVPHSKVNVVQKLVEENKRLTEKEDRAIFEEVHRSASQEALDRATVLAEFQQASNLTLWDKGRLGELAKSVKFSNREEFRHQLEVLHEIHLAKKPRKDTGLLSETFEPEPSRKYNREASPLAIEASRLLG